MAILFSSSLIDGGEGASSSILVSSVTSVVGNDAGVKVMSSAIGLALCILVLGMGTDVCLVVFTKLVKDVGEIMLLKLEKSWDEGIG